MEENNEENSANQMEEIPATEPKIAELKASNAEYLAGWKRSLADYENLNREYKEQSGKVYRLANAAMAAELLPIFEHYKLALNHLPENIKAENWAKGFAHVKDEFWALLKKLDLQAVPTVGEMFDPAVHEAVIYEDSDQPDGTIIKELKAGYTMGGALLSPAQVAVAKNN